MHRHPDARDHEPPTPPADRHVLSFWFWVSVTCALCVTTIFLGMALQNRAIVAEEMLSRAKDGFADIVRTRQWNASYGGVFVEKKPGVPSPPYLKTPDIQTTDGRVFTQKNPALMTRELSELSRSSGELLFRITSLNPLNPNNKPDEGERKALLSFERGVREASWVERTATSAHFRYMAPLRVETSCLSCHAVQGYREGQIRGGISVRYDMSGIERRLRRSNWTIAILAILTVSLLVLLVSMQIRRLARQLAEARRKLEQLATTDTLTSLGNRRYTLERLEEEIARQRRTQSALACAIIDVDYFKRVNDTLGHAAGDAVLQQVALVLKESVRRYDVVGRYGGEEFLAILPGADGAAASAVCERMRRAVEARVRAGGEEGWTVTVSIGCSQLTGQIGSESLIHEADLALYRAKEQGRNRVELALLDGTPSKSEK